MSNRVIDSEPVEVEIEPLNDEGMVPNQFDGDAHVTWKGEDRLFSITEVESSHPTTRCFTIEGGIPMDWFDDHIANAIVGEMGLRMMSVVRFE